MSETYEVFAEMVETLRQAQGAVRQELEALALEPGKGAATLPRLREAVVSFNDQAHALVAMLRTRELPGELAQMAEELADFFEYALGRVQIMLEVSRG